MYAKLNTLPAVPELTEQQQKELNDKTNATSQQQTAQIGMAGEQRGANKTPTTSAPVHQTVWMLTANKTLEPHLIQTGIAHGRVTEIVSGYLKEGDTVVLGQSVAGTNYSNHPHRPAQPALDKELPAQPPRAADENSKPQGNGLL
ncbi:MAG TPA: hypothetical protein VN920_08055 [Pyrinomonadaceae bacterium]|nr:hypothetical protein [Pyrinomonadaceae bacterium]